MLAAERSGAERSLLAGRGLSEARLEGDVKAAQALLERAPRASSLRRLFTEDEPALALRKSLGESRSGRQLADLDLYYAVPLVPGTTAERVAELVASLNALDSVEIAYAEPPAEPAMVNFGMEPVLRGLLAAGDIPPTTPQYVGNQGYLNAAPIGVDARYAWTLAGGNGAGIFFVDIEGDWRTTHEDMPPLFIQMGTPHTDLIWRNHGTAVLGEVVGTANGYGVTGIAHGATAGVSSYLQGTAAAISNAAAAVEPGGVILIELHMLGPADSTPCTCNQDQCNFIAVEYWQANYDAIATATANGVTVVEAAGNGSVNLDEAAYGGAFNRNMRDSGAIVVGASTATTRVPMCWTNFGSRVDVHGWGEGVASMGYGDLFSFGEDQYYTSTFGGTSSAAPIVAGSALSLLGVASGRGVGSLDPRTLRGLLASTGTAQAADARNIGPLPNLRQALQALPHFTWSSAGSIPGQYCTHVYEALDPDTWDDNYLCSPVDHGIQWSYAGPIAGMRCTQVTEPSEPAEHTWHDNYLCVPTNSPLHFSWSWAGPIPGKLCTLMFEPSDPHAWGDNYLCY
ncbi:S8 family serine peptidase [Corallococcus macrosporus]|uniref:S8 family serine peptidase n=1 Tax=Corallococcus macrosporus TaxID=35 RepID=A0ABS3D580_9BACT|nr:S8 family peptidase [Corallococcus macrosporus]MBN8226062.1 S8 family serine peptidase [Corallococcus macrosporus]